MKSWKTTLFGFGLGMMQIFPQVVAGASQNGKVDWKQVGLGLGMVGLGYFAKDKNVTGGDIKQ